MRHTPKPWMVQLRTQESPLILGGDELLDGLPQGVVAETFPIGDERGRETLANARLIAAAPMLLSFVKQIAAMNWDGEELADGTIAEITNDDNHDTLVSLINAARHLIVDAEGNTSGER